MNHTPPGRRHLLLFTIELEPFRLCFIIHTQTTYTATSFMRIEAHRTSDFCRG